MSLHKICRICLRTDIELRELSDNLSDFYEELCDYTNDNTAQLSCSTCEHILKKCYNFKKHCRRADKLLRNWKKKKSEDGLPIHELYQQLPTFKLSYNKTKSPNETSLDIEAVDIKNESPISDVIQYVKAKTEHDDNLNNHDDNINNHDDNINNHDDNLDDDDFGQQNDDEDDRCLSEFLSVIKADKQQKCDIKKKSLKTEDVKEQIENTDEPKIKRNRVRKPLTNQHEFETVFDIQIFHTEADVLREFEQRKMLDRYVTALYKCAICFTVYKCQKLLDFHMRWHDPSAGDFSCNVCHMRFKKYLSVRKHKNDVHFGLYKCKRCPLVTYHKMVMMHHFQKHQGVEFKCKHCNGVYRHSSTYMTHLRTRHKSEHVCNTCARTFVSDVGLMVHRKKVHKTASKYDTNGTAACTECNITFATHAVYIVHVLTTPKHKALAATIIGCPECGMQFENKLQVRSHRRKYHPAYNYSAMKIAERNVLNGRDEDDRVFECTMCGKSGTHNTWLYRHYQAEHPEIPYEQVYNEKRKHLCDECGRSFFTITALREHKYLHTGAKPYSCDQCAAKFRRKTSLKMHLERHLPPTRECQHCGKKFVSASNLSNHMRSHTGDRRYKCEICSKAFLHSAALKEHVRGVHHHIRRPRKLPLKCQE